MFDQFGRYYPDASAGFYNRQNQIPMPRSEVIKVNGKNVAEAYQMAPNSSILLLYESAPIVWLKTTDGAGYPTCTPYSITPYQPAPQVTNDDLLARIVKLEEIVNGKSNATAVDTINQQ